MKKIMMIIRNLLWLCSNTVVHVERTYGEDVKRDHMVLISPSLGCAKTWTHDLWGKAPSGEDTFRSRLALIALNPKYALLGRSFSKQQETFQLCTMIREHNTSGNRGAVAGPFKVE